MKEYLKLARWEEVWQRILAATDSAADNGCPPTNCICNGASTGSYALGPGGNHEPVFTAAVKLVRQNKPDQRAFAWKTYIRHS